MVSDTTRVARIADLRHGDRFRLTLDESPVLIFEGITRTTTHGVCVFHGWDGEPARHSTLETSPETHVFVFGADSKGAGKDRVDENPSQGS